MVLLLLVSSLLGDVAPRRPVSPPPPQCTADSQCQLSTFNGCCGGCCQGPPHAVPVGGNEANRCAAIDCAMPDCSAVRCAKPPDVSEFVAACQAGRCVAVRKEPDAGGQCRIDRDCRVVQTMPPPGDACHQSACGCCPMTRAVPADGVVALEERPGPPTSPRGPQDGKPPFGLSQGGTGAPPAPQCSPCPAPVEGTAACQAGRCVLLPVRPRPVPVPKPTPRPFPHPVG